MLRWGGDIQGGEPYVYADPNSPRHHVGFEIELMAAIAGELGVRAELVTLLRRSPAERGENDMIRAE